MHFHAPKKTKMAKPAFVLFVLSFSLITMLMAYGSFEALKEVDQWLQMMKNKK